ncbi:MAG: T9SS type A sorting domain-containing protein [Bacteroidales bacterium]|nr:T9SS type A sorting domain-containing protein [Bacteroidales bacterium]
MKKVSLLSMIAVLLFGGTLAAQEPQVLINDDFEAYTVGNHLAAEAAEAGNDWWTTWDGQASQDGVIAEFDGTKCAYLTYGNDQVLLLGDEESGIYDLSFDILVPDGKNAYFNILHNFAGSGSTWALESYLHMSGSGTHSPGTGVIHAGGSNAATFTCVYDAWMHFRLHVDTDNDVAEYYYTAPGEEEQMIHTWTWSLNSQGNATVGRKLAAMDFYPPQNANNSKYYLDNFSYTKLSGESIAHLTFDPEVIDAYVEVDDFTSVDLTISNAEGTTIGEWTGWIDFGEGEGGDLISQLNYDAEPSESSSLVGYNWDSPTVVEVATMFPGAAYSAAAMGTNIISAQYLMVESSSGFGVEENTPLVFRVYSQGLYGQPGEVLAEKVVPYSEINHEDWTIATFDTPVQLTGYNVWIACEFTQAVGGYGIVFDGQSYIPYSGYIRTGGGGAFEPLSPDNMSEDYGCLHLRANIQGNAMQNCSWATMSKPDGTILIGQSDEVTISFNSIGLEEGETYEASLIIRTNDPDAEQVIIPISLTVGEVSVSENNMQLANIYPNPATSMVTLEGEDLSMVAIYNVAGQLLRVVKLDNMVNNIEMNVESGVYFFSIYDNNGNNSVQRVVITK